MTDPRPPRSARLGALDILVLFAIALIGLIHLPYPFSGDQALFCLYAREMAEGKQLYIDLWDMKQPGVFWFYYLGGRMFGFNEAGVHLLELLWMLALSAALIVSLRGRCRRPWIASLTPLFTVGVYYAASDHWHLTQVEALVGLPLYLALWMASSGEAASAPSPVRLFVSGLMGAAALLLKLMFLPLIFGFWIVALWLARGALTRREMAVRFILPLALGFAAPLAAAVAYYASRGALDVLAFTFFEFPLQLQAVAPTPGLSRLITSMQWVFSRFAPALAIAAAGIFAGSIRRDPFRLNLLVWMVGGLGVILIQKYSWWAYHFNLLFVPLGVLCALGLDQLWERLPALAPRASARKLGLAAGGFIVLMFSGLIAELGARALFLAHDGFALDPQKRLYFQERFFDDYTKAAKETAFLSEPESFEGDIFVFGNPLYFLFADRGQAISINGWMYDLLLEKQWEQLVGELDQARPPYMFIAQGYDKMIEEQSPSTWRFIEENYRPLRQSPTGVWHVVREK